MPELPEVETIRRVLEQQVKQEKILQVYFHQKRLFKGQSPLAIKNAIMGQHILEVERRAKHLILRLNKGILLLHLGMTGQILMHYGGENEILPDRHTHFTLILSHHKTVYFRDPRQFGRINYLADTKALVDKFQDYGPEPLSLGFNSDYLARVLAYRKAPLKAILLNQKLTPGMGNIYTDEALFLAKLNPMTPAGQVKLKDVNRLVRAIKQVLRAGIKAKGTSISDFIDPHQEKGRFQMRLKVYGRQGQPCPVCGRAIDKIVVAQRGTHWCPTCQARGRRR